MTEGRTEPRWLTRQIVDAVHDRLVRQHGGSFGVRDGGLIDSALARAENRRHYGGGSDLFDLAAAYGYGLAKNHGYVDGNKRVALMAMYVFLGWNGWLLDAPEPEAVVTMEGVAAGSVSEEELARWLRDGSVPRAGR